MDEDVEYVTDTLQIFSAAEGRKRNEQKKMKRNKMEERMSREGKRRESGLRIKE